MHISALVSNELKEGEGYGTPSPSFQFFSYGYLLIGSYSLMI